jgi:hypothetical protein
VNSNGLGKSVKLTSRLVETGASACFQC